MKRVAGDDTSIQFNAFAPHYDAFTSGSDYERWTDCVLAHARSHGLAGHTLLDVPCGTGKSLIPFLARGFDVVALHRLLRLLESLTGRDSE